MIFSKKIGRQVGKSRKGKGVSASNLRNLDDNDSHRSPKKKSSSKRSGSQASRSSSSIFIKILMLICFGNILVVGYFSVNAYRNYLEEEKFLVENGSERIALELKGFLGYVEILLNSANETVKKHKTFGAESSEILFSFERIRNRGGSRNGLVGDGTLYWIDSNKYLIASSLGKVKKPINFSSHDYLEKVQHKSGKLIIGKPFSGAISDQQNIPFAVGAIGDNNRHIGTSMLSITVESFLENFKNLDKTKVGDFAIIDFDKKILIESSKEVFSKNQDFVRMLKDLDLNSEDGKIGSVFSAIKNDKNFIAKKSLPDYKMAVIYSIGSQKLHEDLLKKMRFFLAEGLFSLSLLLFLLLCD